tara:strand:+ start:150 stop:431 length:282 start_codon:yes stop_codon:yes gene_type:complete
MSGVVKKWKKKTWINADILYEDVFYARTPDTENKFPPTVNATYKIVGESNQRSTLEEIPLDPTPKNPTKKEEDKNEETTQTTATVAVNKPTEI